MHISWRCWVHDRQKERREDIKEVLKARGYEAVWDMSSSEQERQYFEGTGVLVLDRVNGVAYVNISERAHPDLAQRWADHLGYKVSALLNVPGQGCCAVRMGLAARRICYCSLP